MAFLSPPLVAKIQIVPALLFSPASGGEDPDSAKTDLTNTGKSGGPLEPK